MKYKAQPGIILTSSCGQFFLVSPQSSIVINETAAFYWNCLKDWTTKQRLQEMVMDEYEVDDKDTLEKEIEAFLKSLLEKGLLMSGNRN